MGGTYRWPGGVLWIADCVACHSQRASQRASQPVAATPNGAAANGASPRGSTALALGVFWGPVLLLLLMVLFRFQGVGGHGLRETVHPAALASSAGSLA